MTTSRSLGAALAASVAALALLSVAPAHAVALDQLTITPPADMTVPATVICGQGDCADVNYTFTVTGGVPPYNLVCNLPPGLFLVGTHTVSCLAQDAADDQTPPASFNLTVTPGGPTPPPPPPPPASLAIAPPADMTVPATVVCGQGDCANVNYTFTVTGGYPPYNLVCNLPPGLFTVGTHTVSCLAQDSEGDSTPEASFTLIVTPGGPTPPPPAPPPPTLAIFAPANITVPATTTCNGAPCAVVGYTFLVTGGYPPYNLVCNLPPGLFLLGAHQVSCLAQDSRGDSTPLAAFTLTVTPMVSGGSGGGNTGGSGGSTGGGSTPAPATSTPIPVTVSATTPTIARHADITVSATSGSGAKVSYSVISDTTATQAGVSCRPASGSLFPLGPRGSTKTTVVTCGANSGTSVSFRVTVLGAHSQIGVLEHDVTATALLSDPRKASLVSLLTRANRALAAADAGRAELQLHTFLTQVRKLPSAIARPWVAAATRIIDVIK